MFGHTCWLLYKRNSFVQTRSTNFLVLLGILWHFFFTCLHPFFSFFYLLHVCLFLFFILLASYLFCVGPNHFIKKLKQGSSTVVIDIFFWLKLDKQHPSPPQFVPQITIQNLKMR